MRELSRLTMAWGRLANKSPFFFLSHRRDERGKVQRITENNHALLAIKKKEKHRISFALGHSLPITHCF